MHTTVVVFPIYLDLVFIQSASYFVTIGNPVYGGVPFSRAARWQTHQHLTSSSRLVHPVKLKGVGWLVNRLPPWPWWGVGTRSWESSLPAPPSRSSPPSSSARPPMSQSKRIPRDGIQPKRVEQSWRPWRETSSLRNDCDVVPSSSPLFIEGKKWREMRNEKWTKQKPKQKTKTTKNESKYQGKTGKKQEARKAQ